MVMLANSPIRQSPAETPQWVRATWADYLSACEEAERQKADHFRVYFNQGYLFVDMGWEGISHSKCRELLTMIFIAWFGHQPKINFAVMGGCIEALSGLEISLVEETFSRLAESTNGSAAQWFAQQIAN